MSLTRKGKRKEREREIKLEGLRCPNCAASIDSNSLGEDTKLGLPPIGSFSICIYCGHVLRVVKNGYVKSSIEEIPLEARAEVSCMVSAVKAFGFKPSE